MLYQNEMVQGGCAPIFGNKNNFGTILDPFPLWMVD